MPEAQNPFLDPEPPHWAARGLAYTFISIFVIAILAAWLVSVPETVSGQFTLVPIRGTDPIRAQKEGVLVEVAVEEGDTVAVGTTLFLIHSGPMSDRSSDLRTLETQLRANQERIRIAASQYETRRRQDDSEQRRLETKVTFLDGLITSKKKRLVLARELADSALSGTHTGSINRLDYTRLELEATSLAEEVQTAQNDLDDAKAALVRLGQDEEARMKRWTPSGSGSTRCIRTSAWSPTPGSRSGLTAPARSSISGSMVRARWSLRARSWENWPAGGTGCRASSSCLRLAYRWSASVRESSCGWTLFPISASGFSSASCAGSARPESPRQRQGPSGPWSTWPATRSGSEPRCARSSPACAARPTS
jgi:hypothetical protein